MFSVFFFNILILLTIYLDHVNRIVVTTAIVNDSIYSFFNTYGIDLMIMKPYDLDSLFMKLEHLTAYDFTNPNRCIVNNNVNDNAITISALITGICDKKFIDFLALPLL